MKKEKVCIWVFQLVRPSNSQNREKNVRFRETYPRVILHSSFEMSIDDVIGMTHRKKKLEKKVWMQNFIMALREINSDISVWFRDQFQKNTEISSNFNMRMVSLRNYLILSKLGCLFAMVISSELLHSNHPLRLRANYHREKAPQFSPS